MYYFLILFFLQGYEYWCIAWVSIFYKWCQYSHCCHRWWRLVQFQGNFCRKIRLLFYNNTKTFFFKDQLAVAVGLQLERMKQPVKIIHKGTFKIFFSWNWNIINFTSNWKIYFFTYEEQDAVTAFCINKVSSGLMAISTQKGITYFPIPRENRIILLFFKVKLQ